MLENGIEIKHVIKLLNQAGDSIEEYSLTSL